MTIVFNKTGYDPFIDFLKASCILVVIFCHGFPYLKEIGYPIWGGQIPLFLMIQAFHCYKRDPKPLNWNVILRRILVPFVVIELCIFCVLFCASHFTGLKDLINNGLVNGGYGPGSYYPWIYLQMAILIPLLRPICEKLGKGKSLMVLLLISEAIEIVCSLISFPDPVYRLLCLRYLLLIWFGWMWAKEGIKLNLTNILISLLSLLVLLYLVYFNVGSKPWLYDTEWITHRWPCYFWMGILLVWIHYEVYLFARKSERITHAVKVLASSSYEIFLVQMAYFAIISPLRFSFFGNLYIQYAVWLFLAFVISILGGIGMLRLEKKYIQIPAVL